MWVSYLADINDPYSMKIKLFLMFSLFLISGVIVSAQTSDEPDSTGDIVFESYQVQVKAQFPGGNIALDKFISKNIKLPDTAYDSAQTGTVIIGFTVEKNGGITNVRVVSKTIIGFGAEEACIKVIKAMPRWEPATQRDKKIRMAFYKPIRLTFN